MVAPRKIKFIAKKKEKENYEFRIFLKCNADEKILDQQFHELHTELFASYDCSKCRNCCKFYCGSIPKEDLLEDAIHLGLSKDAFIDTYLNPPSYGDNYTTKHTPCDFLQKNGACLLGDCKPSNCIDFPYTDKPERMESLLSFLDTIEVCPVAFEIYERLKDAYGFRKR